MTTTATPTRLLIKNVRLAFPNLFEPRVDQDTGRKSYGCSLILPTDHPQLAEIQKAMDAAGQAKWLDKWAVTKKGLEKQDRMALHDGDTKAKYDGFEGNLFISANCNENAAPTVVDQARNPLSKSSGKPYAGCFVNASIEFWAQKDHPKGGSRINAQLRGVQFYKDGDSFSAGRPADADEFDEVTEGADAEDFA
jgi:hypothetical protein